VGTKSLTEIADYCREIETYLCRKNDGHLIRVVGPSFDLVSGWAAQGVPLTAAFSGIDRAVERYHRKGPRRRPIKIDFCEADVLDAFDTWRRAVGLSATAGEAAGREETHEARATSSLPAHLERVVMRLTDARTSESIDDSFEPLIEAAARELESARGQAGGVRGAARQATLARLAALDAQLLQCARTALDEPARASLVARAERELAAFRERMAPEVFARVRDAAFDRLLRERFRLPTIAFH
jgi:hypothetical protein